MTPSRAAIEGYMLAPDQETQNAYAALIVNSGKAEPMESVYWFYKSAHELIGYLNHIVVAYNPTTEVVTINNRFACHTSQANFYLRGEIYARNS